MGIAWTAGTFLPLRGCCRSKRSLPRLLGIHFGLDCITYNHQRWYFHHTELQNWSMENDNRYRVFNVTAVQWEIADRNSWLPTSHDSHPNIPNIPNSLTKLSQQKLARHSQYLTWIVGASFGASFVGVECASSSTSSETWSEPEIKVLLCWLCCNSHPAIRPMTCHSLDESGWSGHSAKH